VTCSKLSVFCSIASEEYMVFMRLLLLNCGDRAASVSVDIEPTSSVISAVNRSIFVLI
jgi:hypothetical protein